MAVKYSFTFKPMTGQKSQSVQTVTRIPEFSTIYQKKHVVPLNLIVRQIENVVTELIKDDLYNYSLYL